MVKTHSKTSRSTPTKHPMEEYLLLNPPSSREQLTALRLDSLVKHSSIIQSFLQNLPLGRISLVPNSKYSVFLIKPFLSGKNSSQSFLTRLSSALYPQSTLSSSSMPKIPTTRSKLPGSTSSTTRQKKPAQITKPSAKSLRKTHGLAIRTRSSSIKATGATGESVDQKTRKRS